MSAAWARRISDLFLLIGVLILVGIALFWVQSALAAQQIVDRRFLIAAVSPPVPLPSLPVTPTVESSSALTTPVPTPEPALVVSPTLPAENQAVATAQVTAQPVQPDGSGGAGGTGGANNTGGAGNTSGGADASDGVNPVGAGDNNGSNPPLLSLVLPLIQNSPIEADGAGSSSGPVSTEPPPAVPPGEPQPEPAPAAAQDAGPIVRLVIPTLNIDRAVISVGMHPDSSGTLQWDTDPLFATANRLDLVGHLATSYNPGQGNNIILIGHNYDNGWFIWEGVFVNLKNLQPGDKIIVYTEGGGEYHYVVQMLKKVPWRDKSQDELDKHEKFLGPTASEQLTLVTCGGANVWPWPARQYVVAVPDTSATP
jgi:hypothetical protein